MPGHAVDQNIVRLHVAMHDVTRVRIRERVSDFAQHGTHGGNGRTRIVREPLRERFAFDKPHREEHDTVDFVDRENRNDVRMVELRRHLRLAQEPRLHLGAERELRRQYLERDLSAQPHIARAVHDRHSAAADFIFDFKERADREFHAVSQRVARGHDRPDSERGVFVLGLIRAISSATYTALSTSRASAIA